ncbi:MAG: thiamine phosphate synthase [Archaeoglobaceae archaeon]
MRGVYFITDPKFGSHEELAKKALDLGVRIIQFREKKAKDIERLRVARALRELTESYDAMLIINERVDLAIAVDADGVHVGQEDLPCEVVKEIFDGIVGVSVSNVDETIKAIEANADYLGAGPVFATTTKEDARNPIGIEGLRKIVEVSKIPVFAIGGINVENVVEVLNCRVDGIAAISAIAGERAKDFIDLVNKYLK